MTNNRGKKLCGWCKDFGRIEGCATCPSQPSSVPVGDGVRHMPPIPKNWESQLKESKELFDKPYPMTTKDYLDEYAGAYRAVDNCSDSLGGVED